MLNKFNDTASIDDKRESFINKRNASNDRRNASMMNSTILSMKSMNKTKDTDFFDDDDNFKRMKESD